MLRIIYGLSTYLRNTQGWCEKYRRSLRRPRRFHGLAIRSLLITLRNGELSVSQVGRPLVHIAASVVVEAQWPATFEWLAAELLDEDRSARRFAFFDERTRPFEPIRPRSGARFAAIDDPLEPLRKAPEMHRRQLRLDAEAVYDGRDGEQFRGIALETGLVDGYEQPDVRITLTPVIGKHIRRIADALRQYDPIEVGRLTGERPQPAAYRLIDLIVEHVGHRRAKDAMAATLCLRRVLPFQWLAPVRSAEKAARSARPPMRPFIPSRIE